MQSASNIRGLSVPLLDDIEPDGKKILVRLDINVPIDAETGEILDPGKIRAHVPTLRELIERGCSVVAMSHQGRPGSSDFVELRAHAVALSEFVGREVRWVDDVIGPAARNAIKELKRGELLLLDNLRVLSEESIEGDPDFHARSLFVKRLYKLFDAYVNDAFASAHRSHASVVGFPAVLPSAAGRLLQKELEAVSRAFDPSMSPKVFVLGGSKLEDSVKLIEKLAEKKVADKILTTGLVAELFLQATGARLGHENYRVLEKAGAPRLLEAARRLLERGAPVELPRDFVVERGSEIASCSSRSVEGLVRDIGEETIEAYSDEIRRAKVVVMRGPAGVVEDPRYRRGTRALVEAAASSGALLLIGGGHIGMVAEELGLRDKPNVHISTGGGALISLLTGEPLPALEALKLSAKRFLGWRC
ncbi:MAG: phosphoglycerate kinase [Fervidicoccaceae archaeon]